MPRRYSVPTDSGEESIPSSVAHERSAGPLPLRCAAPGLIGADICEEDFKALVTGRTLLTILGMALKNRGGQAGTLEDPATWVDQALTGTIRETSVNENGLSVLFAVNSSSVSH